MIGRLRAAWNNAWRNAHAGPIGIGLVGIGGWGAANAAAVMDSRRFDIRGVFDVVPERAERFAQRWKTRACRHYEELLADPSMVAVAITVPNPAHPAAVRLAADAGKHVFVEKPLASTSQDCLDLGVYCRQRHCTLLVGHQMRREPAFRALGEWLAQNQLGRPLFARGLRTLRPRNDWRRDPRACPGGSMEQLGIHLIDVLVSLFGPPLESGGWSRNLSGCPSKPDRGHVSLRFARDIDAVVDSSFASPDRLEFDVFCEQGSLSVRRGRLVCCDGHKTAWIREGGPSGSVAQFLEFADCIAGRRVPQTDAETAAIAARVIASMEPTERKAAA